MKNIIIFILLFLSNLAHADLGSMLLYKAKFVLKNGSSFLGSFEVRGYEEYCSLNKKYCTDKGVQQILVAESHKNQTLIRGFYKKIYIEKESNLGFVSKSDFLKIHVDSIKYTVFIHADHPQYHLNYPQLVEDEALEQIKLGIHKKYVRFDFDMAEVHVLSYNPNLSWVAVSKLVAPIAEYLFVSNLNPEKYSKKTSQKMELKIRELELQKIYIFPISWGSC
jgi:hypothetical protein